MGLTAGTYRGPYEILGPLGAGGMGEVYRARDTRLSRDVAIKVLPQMLSKDEERLRRFEQEARAAGALNHPNVLTIHDVGMHEGTPYVVYELLEGASLRDEIKAGPLPVRKAIDYGIQVARGLAAAHEKGIFHRDLKPDNIFVTTDGRIKILDFGLAKLSETSLDPGKSSLPTTAETEPGIVLGTVGYMSPEQVRGLSVDHRSDIFSFGAVLYEMLSGRRAFSGNSSVETMNAILKEEPPDLSIEGSRSFPPTLDRVVRHCLEKKLEQRFQSARDLAFALEALSSGSGSVVAGAAGLSQPRQKWRWSALVAGFLLLGILAVGAIRWLNVEPPPSWSGVMLSGPEIAFRPRVSPDGNSLVFLAMVDNQSQVAVMDPASGNWRILTSDRTRGTAEGPVWSPDGSRIYFTRWFGSVRNLYSIPALGGEERLVRNDVDAPNPLPDGSLIVRGANEQRQFGLYRLWPETQQLEYLNAVLGDVFNSMVRVSDDGREVAFYGWVGERSPTREAQLFIGEIGSGQYRSITRLVDGEWNLLAFDRRHRAWITANNSGDLFQIARLDPDGGSPVTLASLTQPPSVVDVGADGSLYLDQWHRPRDVVRFGVKGGNLERLAVSDVRGQGELALGLPDERVLFETGFDGRRRLAAGRPHERVFPVAETSDETSAPLALIGDRQIACMIGRGNDQTVAIVSLENGQVIRRLKETSGRAIRALAASPDEKTLYFVEANSIWSIPTTGGEPRKLTLGDGVAPSPDGHHLIIQRNLTEGTQLLKLDVAGGEPVQIPLQLGNMRLFELPLTPNAVAPDGRIIVSVDSPDSWFESAAVIDPRTGRVERISLNFGGDIHHPGWTKDGRIVAAALEIRASLWRFRPK